MTIENNSINPSEELLSYIRNITPEQVDKIINHLPLLTALLAESSQPYPLGHSLQTQST